jgi:hypothetical protein
MHKYSHLEKTMKCIARFAMACAALTFGSGADAAAVGWTAHISQLLTLWDGRIVLLLDADSSSCTDTGTPKHYYIASGLGVNGVTADGLAALTATAMEAFALGKQVGITFDSTSSYCAISQMAIVN